MKLQAVKLQAVVKSPIDKKRYRAKWSDGTHTDFGAEGGSTYIDHHDEKKRANYIARHKALRSENWNDPKSAGALSRYILWGDKINLGDAVKDYKRRFNV